MDDPVKMERELRDLAHVPRWSIYRLTRQQSVAEHSYYVALYAGRLLDALGWALDRGRLYRAALEHDLDETISGDIPNPAKNGMIKTTIENRVQARQWLEERMSVRFPWYREEQGAEYRALVTAADLLEARLFLQEEIGMGNQNVALMCDEVERVFKKFVHDCDQFSHGEKVKLTEIYQNSVAHERDRCSHLIS